MFSQSRAIWRRVGYRCLVLAVAAFLAAPAALPWSAVAQSAQPVSGFWCTNPRAWQRCAR